MMSRVLIILLFVGGFMLAGCQDDPIVGPNEDPSGGGGSYGDIQQLPADTVDAERFTNPHRF